MNRKEHLQWAKNRANEYLMVGDTINAFTSFASDPKKHPELEDHPAIMLGMRLMINGNLHSTEAMQKFIGSFN